MFEFISNWGPETLATFTVLAVILGVLQPKYVVSKQLTAKDELYTEMKTYYESRIADLKEMHESVASDLRRTSDLNQQALGVAVDNNRKLVDQQDEMLNLARVATPALIARTNALELSQNDPR